MEPDIQLAGYYGYSNRPSSFSFITGGSTSAGIPASRLTSTSPPIDLGDDDEVADCGPNFVINILATIEGGDKNNAYFGCPPESEPGSTAVVQAKINTDSFTVRHASVESKAAAALGTVQLISSRTESGGNYILADGTLPTTITLTPGQVEVRDLIVRTYYIAKDTEHPSRAAVPALRVKSLQPQLWFRDDELISGVEDMQIQYGLSPKVDTDGDGVPDDYSGTAVKYVNADKVSLGMRVVAVRLWLLMRAEQPEPGYVDDHSYTLADEKPFKPPADGYRRVLVSKTIQIRNSRTM
jgi:hypothetical protein